MKPKENLQNTDGGAVRGRSRDVRLVELTVRCWCWVNALLPKDAAENPKLLSAEEATLALRRHFTILRQAIPDLF